MKKGISTDESTILKALAILTIIFTHANGKLAFEGVPLLSKSKFTSELAMGGDINLFNFIGVWSLLLISKKWF